MKQIAIIAAGAIAAAVSFATPSQAQLVDNYDYQPVYTLQLGSSDNNGSDSLPGYTNYDLVQQAGFHGHRGFTGLRKLKHRGFKKRGFNRGFRGGFRSGRSFNRGFNRGFRGSFRGGRSFNRGFRGGFRGGRGFR